MSGVSVQPRLSFQRPLPQNSNYNPKQNFWKQNPHANPLVFTEVTHLENNTHLTPQNTYEEHLSDEQTNQFDNNYEYGNNETYLPTYQDNTYYQQNLYENFDNTQPNISDNVDYYDCAESENFLNIASPKDNPS